MQSSTNLASVAQEAKNFKRPELIIEVDAKIDARRAARARKDFKESDRIRDELAAMGVTLKDGKDVDGNPITIWEFVR